MWRKSHMTYIAKKAAEIIKQHMPSNFAPKIAIILGSGAGGLSQALEKTVVIPYEELPSFNVVHVEGEMEHFMISKIEGHNKKMHLGYLNGVPIVCLEGRAHSYEGGNFVEVLKTIIRTMKLLGCEILLSTAAVGSLRLEQGPGSLMLISDHINFMFSNPLIGKNDDKYGERFVSLDNAYDKDLRKAMQECATQNNIPLTEGVYLATSGPTYESHAEIRMFKTLGADVVGMSVVPETIIARHCGLKVTSVAVIANLAAGLSSDILNHQDVLKNVAMAGDNLVRLFGAFIAKFK
jgi:xanthosine phosphorylase